MGAWKLDPTDTFTKSVKSIDRQLKGRLLDALMEISEIPMTPRGDTIKPLTGARQGLWRYRIGDWRLIYEPIEESQIVILHLFAPRGEAYD